jgi:hypothetical protein
MGLNLSVQTEDVIRARDNGDEDAGYHPTECANVVHGVTVHWRAIGDPELLNAIFSEELPSERLKVFHGGKVDETEHYYRPKDGSIAVWRKYADASENPERQHQMIDLFEKHADVWVEWA